MGSSLLILTIWLFAEAAGHAIASAVPEDIKRLVAFVYVENDKKQVVPNGTAFFVGVPSPSDPQRSYIYLVTAKHVLTNGEGGPWLPRIFLRLDKKNGGVQGAEIPLITSGPGKTVFTSNDPTVDIAVIPAVPDERIIDYRWLPAELITSREDFPKLHISEGSEVFFAGLFTPHTGQKKNYPVVRFGRVAMLSDEQIDWNGVPTDLYLIESSSYGGNSGSPVLLYLGADRMPGTLVVGPPEVRLAGVMKGAFQDAQPIRSLATATIPFSVSNLGIAAVVPSYHLRAILFSDELAGMRQ